ncbi:hypothetical protein ACLOJK_012329 [Asimina triloba]
MKFEHDLLVKFPALDDRLEVLDRSVQSFIQQMVEMRAGLDFLINQVGKMRDKQASCDISPGFRNFPGQSLPTARSAIEHPFRDFPVFLFGELSSWSIHHEFQSVDTALETIKAPAVEAKGKAAAIPSDKLVVVEDSSSSTGKAAMPVTAPAAEGKGVAPISVFPIYGGRGVTPVSARFISVGQITRQPLEVSLHPINIFLMLQEVLFAWNSSQ